MMITSESKHSKLLRVAKLRIRDFIFDWKIKLFWPFAYKILNKANTGKWIFTKLEKMETTPRFSQLNCVNKLHIVIVSE